MEFVTIDKWTLLFTWGNLIILFLIMKKLLFKPIKAVIDAREKEISDMYEGAEQAKSDAESMREEYTGKLAAAKLEAENVVKTARRRAVLSEEEILADAHKKASGIIDRAHVEIEEEKKTAVAEIKNEISEMAVDIASRVIEKDISEKDHHELIEKFIDDMGEAHE